MLGRELLENLSKSHDCVGVSRSGRLGTVVCDVSDQKQVKDLFKLHRPELVIHAAAYSDVDGCEREPKFAHASNALSTKYLAENCGKTLTPLIYVSTDYVFDGQKSTPYVETDPTCPVNVYGLTKLEGEYYAKGCRAPSVVVRTSWLFGAGNPNTFVNAIVERLKKERRVPVLDEQRDSPTSVRDLAGAIKKIAGSLLENKSKDKKRTEIFHVCNRGSATRYGMTLKIKEWLGLRGVRVEKADPSRIPNRLAIRPAYGVMSARRYEKFFGDCLRPWEEALRDYLTRCGF